MGYVHHATLNDRPYMVCIPVPEEFRASTESASDRSDQICIARALTLDVRHIAHEVESEVSHQQITSTWQGTTLTRSSLATYQVSHSVVALPVVERAV